MEQQLFNSDELENVEYLVEKNLDMLTNNEEYQKYNKSLSKVLEKLENSPKDVRKLFEEYDTLMLHTNSYEICLAYHIGLKKGIEMQKIK